MRLAVLAPVALLIAGVALAKDRPLDPVVQAKLDKALAGLTPGAPTSCIPLAYPTLSTHTYGRTILYSRGRDEVYRNDTGGGCEAAGNGDILVQVEQEGRPCAGDIIRTVDPVSHISSGSCALNQFVPYRRAR
jgi:hypothetical protein